MLSVLEMRERLTAAQLARAQGAGGRGLHSSTFQVNLSRF